MKPLVMGLLIAASAGCTTTPAEPAAIPSARTVARIESGYALLRNIEVVGVVDSASMNAAAKVRVRRVACTPAGPSAALCDYEAGRCLDDEDDSDGDGWCRRSARFVRVDRAADPFHVTMIHRGWTVDRSRGADAQP
jgi:hypothetical protein